MSRHIEFTVEHFTGGESYSLVDGRNCESPIRIGDVFTKIFGYSRHWDGKVWVAIEPCPTESVRLVIESIEAYRHQLDELSPGMTARIKVVGDGLNKLLENRILGNEEVP